jgi:hypothetical protein
MRRPFLLLAAGLLAGLLPTVAGCGGSAASPFAGTWKVTTLPAGKDITLWLVRIEPDGDGLRASVLSAGLSPFKDATVEEVRADGDALHLTFAAGGHPYAFVFHRPEGESAPPQLLGSAAIRGERDFARLERTDLKALDAQQAVVVQDASGDLERARQAEAGAAKEAALRRVIERQAGRSAEYVARVLLVQALAARGAEAELREQGDAAVTFAAAYGPEMKRQALAHAALMVLTAEKLPGVAVEYARRAEAALEPSTPPDERLPVLRALARALRAAGQDEEAGAAGARAEQAEQEIDSAYEKSAVPFEPAAFPDRKGRGGRVVLVELFTGAQCPPCVAADVAFDALLRTGAPRDVVLVQYHLHIPSPDPLTNADGRRRARYYGVPGTPTLRVDGREGPPTGGGRDRAHEVYDTLVDVLARELQRDAPARLTVTVQRHGERLDLVAEASEVKRTGPVRLRLLLTEDVVRYVGANGQRLHHHVVRACPGGADGMAVTGASGRQEVAVDLAELRKSLRDELADHGAFKGGDWPLDLKRLKVVALLQDDDGKEVLQAAQADVPQE